MKKYITKQIENIFNVKILNERDYERLVEESKMAKSEEQLKGNMQQEYLYDTISTIARNALISRELIDDIKNNQLKHDTLFRLDGLNRNVMGYLLDLADFSNMPKNHNSIAFVNNAEKKFKQLCES